MAIEIRDAVDADLEVIVEIHNAAWRRAYRDLFPDEYLDSPELLDRQKADWQRRFGGDLDYPVRVAESDGKVTGFTAWQRDGDRKAELLALYVTPFHWSTGVGSALLRDARDAWKALGLSEGFAWTAVDNPRAHRSFKKNTWVVSEEDKKTETIDGHPVAVERLTLEL